MPGDPFGPDFQPDDLLFGDRDAVDQFARREQVAAAKAAFVDHVFGIEFGPVVRNHPARAECAADFFVRLGQQNHIAIERYAIALQFEEREDVRDSEPLHVERAAAPQRVTLDGAGERVELPLRSIRRHDIHVVEQDHRFAGRWIHGRLQTARR